MKVIVALLCLCLVVSSALGQRTRGSPPSGRRGVKYEAKQCRIKQLTSSQPDQRIENEGGLIELWDENEEQFQCSGVHAMRVTIQSNSLALPNYHPFPKLVYVEQGEGIVGISFPGCPETYGSSPEMEMGQQQQQEQEQEQDFRQEQQQHGYRGREREQGEQEDELHQKVHRIRQGDIVVVPAGAVHWCYNDRNEDLVTVVLNDLSNQDNQLDPTFRAFFLAGGLERSSQQQQGQQQEEEEEEGMRRGRKQGQGQGQQMRIQNILSPFSPELLAEAFGVSEDLIQRMQETQDRGLIVRVERGQMRIMGVDEDDEDEMYGEESMERRREKYMGLDDVISNGLEESICNTKMRHNLDTRRSTDVYSHRAGRLSIVNDQKLPILRNVDLSAEKVHMYPNTIYTPHWSINSHSIVYVTKGNGQVQVVGSNGETVMDDTVNEGEMFIIPQYFVSTCRAGQSGFEYVVFKTTSSPMKSPIAGYTSVFRAMPVQVIANAYQISPSQAQDLKFNRERETLFLSPLGRRSTRTYK